MDMQLFNTSEIQEVLADNNSLEELFCSFGVGLFYSTVEGSGVFLCSKKSRVRLFTLALRGPNVLWVETFAMPMLNGQIRTGQNEQMHAIP